MTSQTRLNALAGLLSERPFEPHPLLRGGHAQTLAGWAWPRRFGWYDRHKPARGEERLFEVEPGVRLLARCHWQEDSASHPTLLLVHGLGGSDASSYVLGTARLGYQAGMNVVRLNQRNCGGTEHLTPTLYHSGYSGDIRAVVEELLDRLPGVFVAGFSMGGNLALKMAGEVGREAPPGLLGMCAVSPPIDLSETVRRIEHTSNWPYQWRFVRSLKTMMLRKKALYPKLYDLRGLSQVRTVRDFDELYTAPHGGFANAEDYYARASSLSFVAKTKAPTLVLHAQDDPLVPYAPFSRPEVQSNPSVLVTTPLHGGHVGFVSREGGRGRFWAEEKIVRFCDLLQAIRKGP